MARLSKVYDRDEFWDEVTHAHALKTAIANKDFDTWVSNRIMYLTSCLETVMQEQGKINTSDPEFSREVQAVEKQAKDVFGKAVRVRVQPIDEHPVRLAIVGN